MINDEVKKRAYESQSRISEIELKIDNQIVASDTLLDFKYNALAHDKGIYIGMCVPKEIRFKLLQKDTIYSVGQKVEIYHTIKVDEYADTLKTYLGEFYIQEVTYKEESRSLEILAYDLLKRMQVESLEITYPISVRDLLGLITSKYRIQSDVNSISATLLDFAIPGEIYFGHNFKVIDVLRAVTHACGAIGYISPDNILVLKSPTETNYTLKHKNIFKINTKKTQGPINSVVISRQPQNDDVFFKDDTLIHKQGLNELKFVNNPILDLDRENLVEALFNQAKGRSYTATEIRMQANPLIEVGDYISYQDLKGNNYKMLVMDHTLTTTRSEMKCVVSDKTDTAYEKAKSIEKRIIEAELQVDKIRGEITSAVRDISERVKSVEQTTTVDGITTLITETTNTKLNEVLTEKIKEIYQSVDDKLQLKEDAVLIQTEEPEDKTKGWLNPVTGELKLYVRDAWLLVNDHSEVARLLKEQFTILEGKVSSKEDLALLVSDFLKLGNDWETYKKILSGDYDKFKESQDQFRSDLETLKTTITQDAEGLLIKNNQGNLSVRLGNSKLSFLDNGVEVAYVSNQRLFINSGVFLSSLVIGNYKISKSDDGTMLFFDYIGGEY